MNVLTRIALVLLMSATVLTGCSHNSEEKMKILFLHHSTGYCIWKGNTHKILYKIGRKGDTQKWLEKYNRSNNKKLSIEEISFPKRSPYGWNNYPFDYYNIWVKNAGSSPYLNEPTLEMLTKQYDIIIWKHCFPVSEINEDKEIPSVFSDYKSVANYKLQYEALKEKMHEFPHTRFLVWTPAALLASQSSNEQAERVQKFYQWLVESWDDKYDNIFLWDFYALETEGELFLKQEYAFGPNDSHPNKAFSGYASKLFVNRIIQISEATADEFPLTGIVSQ